MALTATVLAAILIGALLFAASRDGGVRAQSIPTATATATATVIKPTSEPSNEPTETVGRADHSVGGFGRLCQILPNRSNQGYVPRGPDTFVQVQRSEGGQWLPPLPAKTDNSGRFTAFVELGSRVVTGFAWWILTPV